MRALIWRLTCSGGATRRERPAALEGVADGYQTRPLRLWIAALQGNLDSLWKRYSAAPDVMPPVATFQRTADSLRSAGQPDRARELMRDYYQFRIEHGFTDRQFPEPG